MIRSKWKGLFIHYRIFKNFSKLSLQKKNLKLNFFSKLINLKYLQKNLNFFIYNKNSVISAFFLNKRVAIYTGNKFSSLIIKKNMINHKFGEFVITKSLGKKIHIIKKKKKK